MSFRVHTPKTLLSSVGDITVARRYYACRRGGCGATQVPFDDWAGVRFHAIYIYSADLSPSE